MIYYLVGTNKTEQIMTDTITIVYLFCVFSRSFYLDRIRALLCEVPWPLTVVTHSPGLSVAALWINSQYLLSHCPVHAPLVGSWCPSSVPSSVVGVVAAVPAPSSPGCYVLESFPVEAACSPLPVNMRNY